VQTVCNLRTRRFRALSRDQLKMITADGPDQLRSVTTSERGHEKGSGRLGEQAPKLKMLET
jgi:hypothetical protein